MARKSLDVRESESGDAGGDAPFESSQCDAGRFLLDPNTSIYGPAQNPHPVRLISTHCAYIFLGREFACKIKRAVDYSYLAMATLEQRKTLCYRELELNQAVLPDIYLKVIAITREPGGELSVNGDGSVVEWALLMRRFEDNQVLDTLAEQGGLTHSIAKALGSSVAAYHQQLAAEEVNDGGARIQEVVEELITELQLLDTVFDQAETEAFAQQGVRALTQVRELLDARARAGFVRRCHGDLHLRNILLHNDRPVPFDALEFDERMATTDTLYDLAFLIMDLDHRAMHRQANIVLNEYLLHSDAQNVKGLAALPLFLFCRAAIKAMTTAQAAVREKKMAGDQVAQAQQYLRQAFAYLAPRRPLVVAVGGLSGSGKSTVAAQLPLAIAVPPGALLLRSDAERKRAGNVPEHQRLPDQSYTPEASAANYARLMLKLDTALQADCPVVLDAVFLSRAQRDEARHIADAHGVPFYGIWLQVDVETMQQRIERRSASPGGNASDATTEVLALQLKQATVPLHWHKVDGNGSVRDTLDAVLAIVTADQTRS